MYRVTIDTLSRWAAEAGANLVLDAGRLRPVKPTAPWRCTVCGAENSGALSVCRYAPHGFEEDS